MTLNEGSVAILYIDKHIFCLLMANYHNCCLIIFCIWLVQLLHVVIPYVQDNNFQSCWDVCRVEPVTRLKCVARGHNTMSFEPRTGPNSAESGI